MNEVFFLKHLKSHFLPKLYDVEEDEEAVYIIEEYVKGYTPVSEKLKENRVSDEKIAEILLSLLDFLCLLHERERPILYLDWKPENLVVTEDGIKVIDFGSAIFQDSTSMFSTLATEKYCAPELKSGCEADVSADIYGFGSILREFAEGMTDNGKGIFFRSNKDKILKLADLCTKDAAANRCTPAQLKQAVGKIANVKRKKDSFPDGGILIDRADRVIGVSGTFRGVGISHICILIAEHLLKKGKKIAFVSLMKLGNEEVFLMKKGAFSDRIDVFNGVSNREVISIINGDYHHIILDFGAFCGSFQPEFLRCDRKFFVFQFSYTKKETEKLILKRLSECPEAGKTELVLNMTDYKMTKRVRKELERLNITNKVKEQGFERIIG